MNKDLIIGLLTLLQLFILIPLWDSRLRERGFPWVTALLVTVNIVIHTWVTFTIFNLDDESAFIKLYPFMETPRLTVDGTGVGALSAVTSTYLHGSIGHLLGNMFILWFFGRKVEDATGHVSFFLLYTLCGFTSSIFSAVANVTLTPGLTPALGASGAIMGVVGAYLFLYSGEKIRTLILIGIIPLWPRLPAWVFIIYNFARDVLLGELVNQVSQSGGHLRLGIGVFAHVGGFLGGMLFIYFFMHPEVFLKRR